MESLFGEESPAASDVVRKGVSILGTARTQENLKQVSASYGATLGSMVGLLVEYVLDHPSVLKQAVAGKFVEDGRGNERKMLAPSAGPDPQEVVDMLLRMAKDDRPDDKYRPQAQSAALREALVQLLNPGDFLDEEAEEAVCRLQVEDSPLSRDALDALEEAREERYRILAAWGDTAALYLLKIHECALDQERKVTARTKRYMIRKAAELDKTLAEFRERIRAQERGSNIPGTLEEAQRMVERRSGRNPLVVVAC